MLAGHVAALCKRAAPLRIGVLPAATRSSVDDIESTAPSLGGLLLSHAQSTGGRGATLALLRSLGAASALATNDGATGTTRLTREALRAAVDAAAQAAADGGGGGRRKKGKKGKSGKNAGAAVDSDGAATDARAESVLASLEAAASDGGDGGKTGESSGSEESGEGVNAAVAEAARAAEAAAAALRLPSGEPVALLNGLVLRGGTKGGDGGLVAAVREAIAGEVRHEARRVRTLIDAGEITEITEGAPVITTEVAAEGGTGSEAQRPASYHDAILSAWNAKGE